MRPVLHTQVGRALGAIVVLGVAATGVAVAHIVAPAWETFTDWLWGR